MSYVLGNNITVNMRPFLSAVQDHGPLLGTFVTFNTPYVAQILARCGFDWLMIDMEHSPLSAQETTAMVHATITASEGTCMPIIRVPSHGVEWIKWALDSGVNGIIVPMVNTREEMEAIVKRGIYPPLGQRSSGPFRAPFADLSRHGSMEKYKSETVKDVVTLPMIESVEGVENAEEIMGIEGVSGVFIGPVDLRSSMGLAGGDGTEVPYVQALTKIVGIGKRLGKPVGILGFEDNLERLIGMGFSYFLLPGDALLLATAATSMLERTRMTVDAAKAS